MKKQIKFVKELKAPFERKEIGYLWICSLEIIAASRNGTKNNLEITVNHV